MLSNKTKVPDKFPDTEDCEPMDIAEEIEEGSPAWMVTFADLMTLLLVFFVLLYSISSIEAQKFDSLLSSLAIAFNQHAPSKNTGSTEQLKSEKEVEANPATLMPVPIATEQVKKKSEAEMIIEELEQMITKEDLDSLISVYTEDDKIIIRVTGQVIFSSGEVELADSAEPIFNEVISLINRYPDYRIAIIGHTDDDHIETVRFPSNWELSAIRATTVLRYFIDEEVNPRRMSATGYSDLFPIADNETAEGRSLNRRVEFVLEK